MQHDENNSKKSAHAGFPWFFFIVIAVSTPSLITAGDRMRAPSAKLEERGVAEKNGTGDKFFSTPFNFQEIRRNLSDIWKTNLKNFYSNIHCKVFEQLLAFNGQSRPQNWSTGPILFSSLFSRPPLFSWMIFDNFTPPPLLFGQGRGPRSRTKKK